MAKEALKVLAETGRTALADTRRLVGGRHQVVDFTLPFGRVLHDYLA